MQLFHSRAVETGLGPCREYRCELTSLYRSGLIKCTVYQGGKSNGIGLHNIPSHLDKGKSRPSYLYRSSTGCVTSHFTLNFRARSSHPSYSVLVRRTAVPPQAIVPEPHVLCGAIHIVRRSEGLRASVGIRQLVESE